MTKRYGRTQALDGVTVTIPRGEVTALLGPNGAGKTTLLKAMLGLVRPDAGDLLIDGTAVRPGDSTYRDRIGYMPQTARYPANLTANEVMATLTALRRREPTGIATAVEELALEPHMDRPLGTLSGGTRQRVSAALALAFEPDILFLDEPTAGLDPVSSSRFKDRIAKERKRGRTVVLTSHLMAEVEEMADRVIYLLEGRLHLEDTVQEFLTTTGERTLERAIARLLTARIVA